MTNDLCKADQQVQETLKYMLASQNRWRDSPYMRVPVFAILRGFLARENGNGFQSTNVEDGSLGLENGNADSLSSFRCALLHLNFYDREAVILTKAVRFSDSDTSDICECSAAMVRRRALRGVAKLAEMMQEASGGWPANGVRLAARPDTDAALK
jgi:DNA-directed RNA polymerase specialized sigma24 family protein